MFNVIPPINGRNVSFTPQKNKFAGFSNALAPLKADTTSFTGTVGVRKLDFLEICGNFLNAELYRTKALKSPRKLGPEELYLSNVKLIKKLHKAHPEDFMHILSKEISEIAAKRLELLGRFKNEKGAIQIVESGSFSHPPYSKSHAGSAFMCKEPSTFTFHPKGKVAERYTMDWTEQYNAIKKVFEETGEKREFKSTIYDFEAAKDKLQKELQKLGLML